MSAVSVSTLLWIVGGVTIASGGGFLIITGYTKRGVVSRVANTERTTGDDLQAGTIDVEGTVRPASDATILESPFEEREAVLCHVEVEKYVSNGEGGSWKLIHEDFHSEPILIDTGASSVRVEFPESGELAVDPVQTEVDSFDEPSERISRYVATEPTLEAATRRQYGPIGIGDSRRFSERVVKPGDSVYLHGAGREIQTEQGGRRVLVDSPT